MRCENHTCTISGFLIDYWCLGVKDALLRKGDRQKYEIFKQHVENTFGEKFEEISLEQAQAIVFGAVDYASSLGFQPHADFERGTENFDFTLALGPL